MPRIATLTILPLLLVAACGDSRHLWPLDLADTVMRTASFAILNARANSAPVVSEEPSVQTEPVEETPSPAPPAREETQQQLPRSDDEVASEAEEEVLDEGEEEEVATAEEMAEAEAQFAEQTAEAERLQAMEQELAAIEEQLREQQLTNEAIAATLIVHMQRITLTQLALAAALGGSTKP